MQDDNPNTRVDMAYLQNLTLLAGVISLGGAVLSKTLGDDATSTQVEGRVQDERDLQEMLAAQLSRQLTN